MRRMADSSSNTGGFWRRRAGMIALMLLLMAVFLGLDLRSRGLAWQFFWSQTGEEEAPGQIRGMVEVAGNLIRHPLATDPLASIDHKAEISYGINTFLEQEVERPKIEAMLRMIREAGFVWLRQEFPWEDLEIDGRGQFSDSRDRDGDDQADVPDTWAKYDQIVELTEAHGLRLMVRLSNPPSWSRENPDAGDRAPPDDFGDFVNYARAVAERYRGRISHYQIWNEPNIYPEWGNNPIDPAAYTELLCRTYDALMALDSNLVIVSGAIAPTIALDQRDLSDLVFLQALYDHGGGECFDVLSAQGYGLFSGPTDRRLRATSVNVARHTYYRDIMVRNGDGHKPIWLSEAAWNATLDAELPPEQISLYANYGNVTQAQAARFMPLFYDRIQQEWPWVGNVMYWFFTRKDPFEADQAFYYFRMAEPDYQPEKPTFTPLPVYHSVKDYINNQRPTLYRGTHQAETWQIQSPGTPVSDNSARFGRATQVSTRELNFTAHGTALDVRWRSVDAEASAWRRTRIELSPGLAQTQRITFGAGPLIVDEIAVFNRSTNRLLSWMALAAAGVLVLLGTVFLALRERMR